MTSLLMMPLLTSVMPPLATAFASAGVSALFPVALLSAALVVAVGVAATKIQWAEKVWNPTTGCVRVSLGCQLCYMFSDVENRLQYNVHGKYAHGTELTLHPHTLADMVDDTSPAKVFVNSMSDLFHEAVPDEYIFEVFEHMALAPWHLYMILTKRDERLRELGPSLPWADHVLMGVTVENHANIHRLSALRACGASRTFVSFEPLIGSVVGPNGVLDLSGIDYAIAGGESAKYTNDERRIRKPIPMQEEWATQIRDACAEQDVAFHFKQWGAFNKAGVQVGAKDAGRELQGRTYDEEPAWYESFMARSEVLAAAARVSRGPGKAPVQESDSEL